MSKNWWLIGAIFFVGISILVSGHWIASSLSSTELVLKHDDSISVNNSDKISKDLLSISEAAAYIKVNDEKIKWLVNNSKLYDGNGIPFYKIDNEIWFSKKALSDWIEHSAEYHYEY